MSKYTVLRNIIKNVVKSNKDKDVVKFWLKEANKNHNVMYDIHKHFNPDFPGYSSFEDLYENNEYYRNLGGAKSVEPIKEFDWQNSLATTLDDPEEFPLGMPDYLLERNKFVYNRIKDYLPKDYVETYDRNPLIKAILEKALQNE